LSAAWWAESRLWQRHQESFHESDALPGYA
jgi:hypothetical protein